jgi:hypothetical protein
MYKYNDASGGDTFGGWLSAFLWYINEYNWDTRSWDHSGHIPRLTSNLKVKNEKLHDWRKLRGPWDGIPSGAGRRAAPANPHSSGSTFTIEAL